MAVRTFDRVPLKILSDLYTTASTPAPWLQTSLALPFGPDVTKTKPVRTLSVLTAPGNLFMLDAPDELYRIMWREGALMYVFEGARPAETIIEAHVEFYTPPRLYDTSGVAMPVIEPATRVLPFRKGDKF